MSHLHWTFRATVGNVVEAKIDRAANVLLLTEAEYTKFQRGDAYRYHGGHYTSSPVRIAVPYYDTWHVATFPGPVNASVSVV